MAKHREEPRKTFPLRLPPDLHEHARVAAVITGAASLHDFIIRELRKSEAVKAAARVRVESSRFAAEETETVGAEG